MWAIAILPLLIAAAGIIAFALLGAWVDSKAETWRE